MDSSPNDDNYFSIYKEYYSTNSDRKKGLGQTDDVAVLVDIHEL